MAGSIKQTYNILGPQQTMPDVVAFEFDWQGDLANGSVPTVLATGSASFQGFIVSNVTITSQALGYSVRVLDSSGIDLLEGQGLNIASTAVAIATTSNVPPLFGGFNIQISNNSVLGAKGKILVFLRRISLTQLVTQPTGATVVADNVTPADVSEYDWSFVPSSTIALVSGTPVTINMGTLPTGINSQSPNKHYISVVYSGGHKGQLITALSGSSITFTPNVSAAAGTWTMRSSSGGIQEAIYGTSYTALFVPQGVINYDGMRIWMPRWLQITGAGKHAAIIEVQELTANVFLSDEWGMDISGLWFRPSVSALTGGVMCGIIGTSPLYNGDADMNVQDCEFWYSFDAIKCDWPGGFMRLSNNVFRGISNSAVYYKATNGAVQIVGNYADGRFSQGLIRLYGALSGGVIAANWMQASYVHVLVETTNGPVNELLIQGNLFDQDSASVACVMCNGNGTYAESNCVKIADNWMRGQSYAVLVQDCSNVIVQDNYCLSFGTFAPIAIAGTIKVQNIWIDGNRIWMRADINPIAPYAIQLSNPDITNCWVNGNNANSLYGNSTAMIGISSKFTALQITANQSGQAILKLIDDVGSTGAGEAQISGNQAYNMPTITVAAAATLVLPAADDEQVVGITATGTPITEMNGITARSGSRRTFVTGGAVAWATSGATDNKIGRAYGPTVAGQVITFIKYSDNLWYPIG